jgi:predicted DNA-binding transcriptional regulator AlpA
VDSTPQHRLWTVADVAARMGVALATVRTYRSKGVLPEPKYIGRTPVWEAEVIEHWLAERPGQGVGGGRRREGRHESSERA